jgi:hypothetical protein
MRKVELRTWRFRRSGKVEVEKWKHVITTALDRNSNLGNDAEVCWLLWMMKELKISVPAKLVEVIISRCGAFPIVMFCHLSPRSIRQSPARQDRLVSQLGELPFVGPFWLLAYEAAINDWIPDDKLARDKMPPFMREMATNKVSFFDRGANPRFMRPDGEGDASYEDYAIEDMAGRYDDDDDDDDDERDGDIVRRRRPWEEDL